MLACVGMATPAAAATATAYAQWEPLTGTAGDYATTMRLSPRFPLATVTSDSRGGQIGVQSGATSWLPAWTPVGERYGSSRDEPYLNLRPKADGPTTPSTTIYTFERSTPTGWAFVLGDIDADQVSVSAVTDDGSDATAAELGFRGTFNTCAQTPRPSSCPGTQTDEPTWDPATTTLRGNDGARDTTGAAGWFEPTVSLQSLTFEFTRRSGFPVFQTWFALRTQDVTGSVTTTAGTCDVGSITVDLIGVLGNVIDTATPDATGAFSFAGLAASAGYRVALAGLPADCRPDGPSRQSFDLRAGDAVVALAVRQIVPASIEGTVSDDAGAPLGGVTVTVTPQAGGDPVSTTTDEDGRYVVDALAPGTYVVTVAAPDGYTRTTPDLTAVIPVGDDTPIVDQDFVVAANPDVGGRVAAGGDPVAGVPVELRDGAGDVIGRTVTQADGSYVFPRVVPGTYTVAVPDPPLGYAPPPARTFEVTAGDSLDNDFALTRPGFIGGLVSGPDGPRAGVGIRLTGPDGFDQRLTTDADGRYGVAGLAAGDYSITISPPEGTTAEVVTLRTTITEAGENRSSEDFTLAAAPTSPPTTADPTTPPPTTASPTTGPPTTGLPTTGLPTTVPPSPSGSAPGPGLASTGMPGLTLLWLGGGLVLLGFTLVGVTARGGRRARARH